jgi:hypothetical protein
VLSGKPEYRLSLEIPENSFAAYRFSPIVRATRRHYLSECGCFALLSQSVNRWSEDSPAGLRLVSGRG